MNICIYKHDPRVEVTLRILEGYEEAFMELGHRVMILSHEIHRYTPEEARNIAQQFLEFDPNIAVCYGFSAMPETNGSYFFRKRGIPLLVLCFENPFFGLDEKIIDEIRSHPDYYYFFVWDKFYLNLLRKRFKHCYPIRHATQMISTSACEKEVEDRFEREVTFVGNIPLRSGVAYNSSADRIRVNRLVGEFASRKIGCCSSNIIEFLKEDAIVGGHNNGSLEKPSYHRQQIYPLYAEGLSRYRRAVLKELKGFDIHCYGDCTWDMPHIGFHEPVSYTEELPSIYASSAVNLDIPPFQSIDSLTNRVFDVAGTKSLVLTEYKPDLEEIYDDPEPLVYRSISELKEKIRFYVGNPSARREVVKKLHDLVRRNHTYACRAEYVMEILSGEGGLR